MPWIHVVATPASDGAATADLATVDHIAAAAATALGLQPHDVVVMWTPAQQSAGAGAVAYVSGRRRSAEQEIALAPAVRASVSRVAGVEQELVSVVRL